MFFVCFVVGRYGRWLEIIVFNNVDYYKSLWEIILNIIFGFQFRNIVKGNCFYDV